MTTVIKNGTVSSQFYSLTALRVPGIGRKQSNNQWHFFHVSICKAYQQNSIPHETLVSENFYDGQETHVQLLSYLSIYESK